MDIGEKLARSVETGDVGEMNLHGQQEDNQEGVHIGGDANGMSAGEARELQQCGEGSGHDAGTEAAAAGQDVAAAVGEGGSAAAADRNSEIVLAPASVSTTSKALGMLWFLAAHIFTEDEFAAMSVTAIIMWSARELYWSRRWLRETEEVKRATAAIKEELGGHPASGDDLKQLCQIASDVAASTKSSMLRKLLDSVVVAVCIHLAWSFLESLWTLCTACGLASLLSSPPSNFDALLRGARTRRPTAPAGWQLAREPWELWLLVAVATTQAAACALLWIQVRRADQRRVWYRAELLRAGCPRPLLRALQAVGAAGEGEDGEREDGEREASMAHASAALVHAASTSDVVHCGAMEEDVVAGLITFAGGQGDAACRESVCTCLLELLGGKDPGMVLSSAVKLIGERDAEVRLETLQTFVSLLPKQCSNRVRQAMSKTGILGALIGALWGNDAFAASEAADQAGDEGEDDEEGGEREEERARKEAADAKSRIIASNLLVRLATQMEWESDRTPVFDEIATHLCQILVYDPSSGRAEQACTLLAVLANTLANTMAYMRLYEVSAETMPLRLEQVRYDVRRMASEQALHRSSASLLQSKSSHFANIALGPLGTVVTSREATEAARAAAALCIGLLAWQRPSLPVSPAVVESIAGMLVTEPGEGNWLASYSAEALGALSSVPDAERQFGDQGVVELLVMRAGTGDAESRTSATTVLALLARRRRSFRVQCRESGAVEVLQELEQSQLASIREVASHALRAMTQSLADDVMQMCSSTGYVCLVVFCFFVQLGGVHAVVDILDVFIDILHVLSRITSARSAVREPSLSAIVADFAVNDPAALVLLASLFCIVPGLLIWAIFRHTRRSYLRPSSPPAGKAALSDKHHSWLLGMSVVRERDAETGEPGAYVVTDVYTGGPASKSVRVGDEVVEVDGVEVGGVPLSGLVAAARGGRRSGRLSVAQRLYWWWAARLGLWGSGGGRGTAADMLLLRRKEGRKKYRKVTVVRGNWYGRYDPAPEACQTAAEPMSSRPVAGKTKGRKCEGAEAEAEFAAGRYQSSNREETEEDERVCRICQCTEEESPEQGKLFSPCHCRGTMRFIHEGCLETWRRMSANASSTFKCDQCSYFYRVRHTGLANFVRRPGVVELTAVVIFAVGVLATGMLVKWAQIGWALEAGEQMTGGGAGPAVMAQGDGEVTHGAGQEDRWAIGWSHVVQGCVGVGIIGFSTLVILLPMRGFGFIGYHPNLFRGTTRGDSPASVVLFIIVVAGMVRALFLCHKLSSWLAMLVAERSGTVILAAEEGHQSAPSIKSRIPRWLRAVNLPL